MTVNMAQDIVRKRIGTLITGEEFFELVKTGFTCDEIKTYVWDLHLKRVNEDMNRVSEKIQSTIDEIPYECEGVCTCGNECDQW